MTSIALIAIAILLSSGGWLLTLLSGFRAGGSLDGPGHEEFTTMPHLIGAMMNGTALVAMFMAGLAA